MKYLILLMVSLPAYAATTSFDLIGSWKIDGYLYRQARIPAVDTSELDLRYVFNFDHTAVVTFTRQSTNVHCENHVSWDLVNGAIVQNVTWVNPENSPACANDPEMPTQEQISTALRRLGPDIALQPNDVTMPVFYVFTRVDRPGSQIHD